MAKFDYKKWIIDNKYQKNPTLLNEGTLEDLGDKVKPAIEDIFNSGRSKSKEVYSTIKRELTDEGNQEKAKAAASKALNVTKNVYKVILGEMESLTKSVGNKITPENAKRIRNAIPSLGTMAISGTLGAIAEIIHGTTFTAVGFGPWKNLFIKGAQFFPDVSLDIASPDFTIMIVGILVALKVIMFALQYFLKVFGVGQRIVKKVKGVFKENEDEMGDVNFSDIKALFELNYS
tara:strand:+ start:37 stop:735 length:699 start_codon:yes stop_codon:yes gene_type:complete